MYAFKTRTKPMVTTATFTETPKRGMLAGICAGLADYFNIQVWAARLDRDQSVYLCHPAVCDRLYCRLLFIGEAADPQWRS